MKDNSPQKSPEEIRESVREDYAQVANHGGRDDCGEPCSCCCPPTATVIEQALKLGYSQQELEKLPEGANMALGCGNPQAIADLKAGETVLDLGSGGGIDCFLAAGKVGPQGKVIGVDMTTEMVSKATAYAREGGYDNVEFRLGKIEDIPVADDSVDVIMSNCVINLSPDKPRVFRETFRVLKSGGRLAVSDVVATAEIPDEIRNDPQMISGCIGGAAMVQDVERMLQEAGFGEISIKLDEASRKIMATWAQGRGIEKYVCSASIEAVKP